MSQQHSGYNEFGPEKTAPFPTPIFSPTRDCIETSFLETLRRGARGPWSPFYHRRRASWNHSLFLSFQEHAQPV